MQLSIDFSVVPEGFEPPRIGLQPTALPTELKNRMKLKKLPKFTPWEPVSQILLWGAQSVSITLIFIKLLFRAEKVNHSSNNLSINIKNTFPK
jgi:hypothetical protein